MLITVFRIVKKQSQPETFSVPILGFRHDDGQVTSSCIIQAQFKICDMAKNFFTFTVLHQTSCARYHVLITDITVNRTTILHFLFYMNKLKNEAASIYNGILRFIKIQQKHSKPKQDASIYNGILRFIKI